MCSWLLHHKVGWAAVKLLIMSFTILFICFLLIGCSGEIQENKSLSILLSAFPSPGHFLNFLILGDALKEQGHNVTFLIPHFSDYNKPKELCEEHGFHYIPIPVNISYHGFKAKFNQDHDLNIVQIVSYMTSMFSTLVSSINSFISNELDTSKFDVAVIEDFLIGTLVCPKNEDLPIVFVSPGLPIDPSLLPSWPFPHASFSSITHDTSITDRLIITAANALLFGPIQKFIISYLSSNDPDCWERKYNNYLPPGHGVPFILATVMGFEYPKSNLPLVDYVGPFIPNTLDPLPSDIDLWLNSKKENSVIYISMGSVFTGSQKLAEALYNGIPSNYSVLWSAASKTIPKGIEDEPSNDRYLIKSWIPQISALNHPAISLAILHGGAGGVHQALYFGIPMIVIPLMGDQYSKFYMSRVRVRCCTCCYL